MPKERIVVQTAVKLWIVVVFRAVADGRTQRRLDEIRFLVVECNAESRSVENICQRLGHSMPLFTLDSTCNVFGMFLHIFANRFPSVGWQQVTHTPDWRARMRTEREWMSTATERREWTSLHLLLQFTKMIYGKKEKFNPRNSFAHSFAAKNVIMSQSEEHRKARELFINWIKHCGVASVCVPTRTKMFTRTH